MPSILPPAARAVAAFVLLAAGLPAWAGDPPDEGLEHLVDRFDQAVASGLPARIPVPPDSGGRSRRDVRVADGIVVERRLAVDLRMPDDAAAAMYAGTLDGEHAVFTRAARRLDVSIPEREGVRLVGFAAGRSSATRRMFPADAGRTGEPKSLDPSVPALKPGHLEDPLAYHPTFHIFIHDDLRHEDVHALHARFVAWWLHDLLDVLPAEPVVSVYYYMHVPWVSDIDYERDDVLDGFSRALRMHAHSNPALPYGLTYKHKFLLLTAGPAVNGSSGLAFEGQSEATASITGRNTVVAHEFGHTLGATHDKAEIFWMGPTFIHGWLWGSCDTNMHPMAPSDLSCLLYSEENQRAIRSYLRHGPFADRRGVWLER